MTVPSDYPRTSANWKKTYDGDDAKVWRNGQGKVVTFTRSFNANTDYWELTDTTNTASEGKSFGPFETYIDGLEYVNTFLPNLGTEELPDDVVSVPDDSVVEIGSYPAGATDRECSDCESTVFTSYRIEYGDESHEWLCPPCASDRFEWDFEKETTVDFTVNGSGAEGRDALRAAENVLEGHADALLDVGMVDVNGLATTFETLGRYKYDRQRDNPDEPPPAYGFKRDVHDLIIEYREEHPDIKWYKIRDALNEMRQYAHEYAREQSGKLEGRREVLDEIEESGLTPNEWFEQNVNQNSN